MAQINIGKFRSAPGERRPRFKKWVCFLVETIEVVGYPQAVKLWSYRWEDVFTLVLHYGLIIAPLVTDYRRQPPKFWTSCVLIHTKTPGPYESGSRPDCCSPTMLILATSALDSDQAFPQAERVRPWLAVTKYDVLIAAKNRSYR